jgi:hypothetical protein
MNASMRHARRLTLAGAGALAVLASTPAAPAPILCPGNWAKVADSGPIGRNRHSMAYFSARERIVLFGGLDAAGNRLGDTWEWDGSHWTLAADSGPSPRTHTSIAYDSLRRVVVLFGGVGQPGDYYGDNNDTWRWDGSAWKDISDPGRRPPARNGQGLAYDIFHHKLVMFGGGITFEGVVFGDTWVHDDGTWQPRPAAGGPGISAPYPTFTYDRQTRQVIQFALGCGPSVTWAWDGHAWSAVPGAQPSVREAAALAYDSARHRVVLFGGDNCVGGAAPDDTWEWDGHDWQRVDPGPGPGPRTTAAPIAYDSARGKTVLFGGDSDTGSFLGDTWTWTGPTYRCEVPIPGDLNCDGVVDVDDLQMVDVALGEPACAADDSRDLDGDGRITARDKVMLRALCTFAGCARHDGSVNED